MTEPMPNGNAPPFDLTDPDLHEVAGYVASLSADMRETKAEVKRQGRLLDRIAMALGVEADRSDPPPNYRERFDSQQQEIERLRAKDAELEKHDADTSQNIQAVSKEVAETKLIVRVGLIKGIPKLVKVGAGLTAALVALTALGAQIWAAIRGH